MVDFIHKDENLLTKDECDGIIKWVFDNKKLETNEDTKVYTGYDSCEIMNVGENFHHVLSPPSLTPLKGAIDNMLEGYMKKYPESCNMNHWELEHIRFQWWQPGRYFSKWHSEHMKSEPYRVLTYLIYLSDNDCSTDFKRYPSVESKAGCGIIFPAYFTHEHKGNPCKKGLDRYVLTGYFSFV